MDREDVFFESGDARCAAWLYRPPAADGAPCVVMAHGFGATRHERLAAFAERFAGAGLAALVFDYRHFGDSGGAPRQVLDIGRQHDDYRAAVRFARRLEGVDPARVALWGSSFSGGHVTVVAAEDPSIAAAVIQAPFMDGLLQLRRTPPATALRLTVLGLRDELAARRGAEPVTMPLLGAPGAVAAMTSPDSEAGYRAMIEAGSPWREDVAARLMLRIGRYRPVRRAPDVRCPLLVCVADRDDLTPPEPAVRCAELAPRGELRRYGLGHFDVYRGDGFERVVADQVEFLARHLGVGAAAAA